MTMSRDRLSRLPDPVLLQVLTHAPAKEAVCTGALSRPWRSLWLSSGILNLDSRSYVHRAGQLCDGRSLIFIRDAKAALCSLAAAAAADGENSLKTLTFTYLPPGNGQRDEYMYCSQRHIDDGLDALLTGAPAARSLEELHVYVSPRDCYSLRVAALPSDALRALHLDGLCLTSPLHSPQALAPFALLETLRLCRCAVRLTDLAAIVDSAPLLAALELDRVHLSAAPSADAGQRRLRCPRVTALALGNVGGWYGGLELDVPSLRRFAYRGFLQQISFVPPPPANMARADLHFDLDNLPDDACQLFWHFVGDFGGAEVLNVSFEQPGARPTGLGQSRSRR
ncbi:hypothetical protein ACQ4PT_052976 [Festuca glaucescens]